MNIIKSFIDILEHTYGFKLDKKAPLKAQLMLWKVYIDDKQELLKIKALIYYHDNFDINDIPETYNDKSNILTKMSNYKLNEKSNIMIALKNMQIINANDNEMLTMSPNNIATLIINCMLSTGSGGLFNSEYFIMHYPKYYNIEHRDKFEVLWLNKLYCLLKLACITLK